ncbi:hypothetical protein MUK42_35113 [Musa troglodytarum]|uniref:Uncharacterized protein n=1 Tax=Musa troglodytarum TaxID=320322 RepID=A0A9E7EJ63_9LILI|nr:hypothetical protein MUK42_35113 [Musa troglodytarum]
MVAKLLCGIMKSNLTYGYSWHRMLSPIYCSQCFSSLIVSL